MNEFNKVEVFTRSGGTEYIYFIKIQPDETNGEIIEQLRRGKHLACKTFNFTINSGMQ